MFGVRGHFPIKERDGVIFQQKRGLGHIFQQKREVRLLSFFSSFSFIFLFIKFQNWVWSLDKHLITFKMISYNNNKNVQLWPFWNQFFSFSFISSEKFWYQCNWKMSKIHFLAILNYFLRKKNRADLALYDHHKVHAKLYDLAFAFLVT